jgi:hypothetical protein
MAKVAFKQADVSRMIRGALAAGLVRDQFKLVFKDGELSLLPAIGSETSNLAEDTERRMREAFGE